MSKERENDQSREKEKENKQEDDNTGADTPCRHTPPNLRKVCFFGSKFDTKFQKIADPLPSNFRKFWLF